MDYPQQLSALTATLASHGWIITSEENEGGSLLNIYKPDHTLFRLADVEHLVHHMHISNTSLAVHFQKWQTDHLSFYVGDPLGTEGWPLQKWWNSIEAWKRAQV